MRIIHHKVSLLLHLAQRNIYSFREFSSSSEFILPGVSPPVPLGFFSFVFTFKTWDFRGNRRLKSSAYSKLDLWPILQNPFLFNNWWNQGFEEETQFFCVNRQQIRYQRFPREVCFKQHFLRQLSAKNYPVRVVKNIEILFKQLPFQ